MNDTQDRIIDDICPNNLNGRYIHAHGQISEDAKELCRRLKAKIERQTARGKIGAGDALIAHGYRHFDFQEKKAGPVLYNNAHIESFGGYEDGKWHCCTQPSTSFIGEKIDLGALMDGVDQLNPYGFYLSTSGGYWFSALPEELIYVGTREKTFWTWGDLPCADGGVVFKALVNVWDYTDLDKIY